MSEERSTLSLERAAEIASAELVSESFHPSAENVCDAVEAISRNLFGKAAEADDMVAAAYAHEMEVACYECRKEAVNNGHDLVKIMPQYAGVVADAVDAAVTYEQDRQGDKTLGRSISAWSNTYLRGE